MKNRIANIAVNSVFATMLACIAPTLQAAQDHATRFAEVGSLSDLVARLGRDADSSEQGGACGGIVVHDWVAENIRVIALGDLIQVVSPLRDAK